MQQLQQCALVNSELFQRLALDARHDTGNEPARQAHLNDSDQRAVRFKGGEGSAQVVQLLHGLHRSHQRRWNAISSPPPHTIFHHGIRGRGGTIYWAALPSDQRQVQADMRTHLIHRPARDIFPPQGGARFFSIGSDPEHFSFCCCGLFSGPAELGAVHPHAVMITASRRASATIAFFMPRRLGGQQAAPTGPGY